MQEARVADTLGARPPIANDVRLAIPEIAAVPPAPVRQATRIQRFLQSASSQVLMSLKTAVEFEEAEQQLVGPRVVNLPSPDVRFEKVVGIDSVCQLSQVGVAVQRHVGVLDRVGSEQVVQIKKNLLSPPQGEGRDKQRTLLVKDCLVNGVCQIGHTRIVLGALSLLLPP